MRIDPANTAPVQPPITHELYDISVRHAGCLMHSLVVGQQLLATALVADNQLAEDEVVTAHFVTTQEPVQFTGVWRSIGQEPNPDRRVNQERRYEIGKRFRRTGPSARVTGATYAESRTSAAWRVNCEQRIHCE